MRFDRLQSREPSPVEAAIASELVQATETLLKTLPSRLRRILELSYLQSLSNDEIARIKSIPIERVRTIHSTAMRKLIHQARRPLVDVALGLLHE
jgi:RNA polymerase sigma factor (sigma-70 family)